MKRHRNLKIFSIVGGSALVVWLAFVYDDPFWWSCFAALVITIIGWRALHSYKRRRFNNQRRAVMESVEKLFTGLAFFDEGPFLDRYSRFRFQVAVNHAALLGHALKSWVMDMQKRFDDGDMPSSGLKMSEVPALTEQVGMEVSAAFRYIKHGAKGKAPSILDDDWFDPVTIFGADVAIFRTVEEENVFRPDYMKKPTHARPQSTAVAPSRGSTALATTVDARATEIIPPAEPRRLTYKPGHDGPVVNLSHPGGRQPVEVSDVEADDNKVVKLDFSRRKAKN
jgi:hypothetical protein